MNASTLLAEELSPLEAVTNTTRGTDEIIIASSQAKPFLNTDQAGNVTGAWASKINTFLNSKGVKYRYYLGPWTRSYHEATTQPNVLIANLDRTPEREDHFYWLMPLQTKTQHILTLKDGPYDGMTLQEALASDGTAMCLKGSSQCQSLRDLGFPDHRVLPMRDMANTTFATFMIAGRFAFWMASYPLIASEMEEYGLDSSQVTPLFEVDRITAYLAASHSIDPKLLEKLRQ